MAINITEILNEYTVEDVCFNLGQANESEAAFEPSLNPDHPILNAEIPVVV